MNDADKRITDKDLRLMFGGAIPRTDTVRFYLDANVFYALTDLLRDAGLSASSVYMMGIQEEKADTVVLYVAREMGALLVTFDEDLREIDTRIRAIEGLRHAGIILVTSDSLKSDIDQLSAVLVRLAQKYEGSSDLLWNTIFPL